jgi:hypothetical protein
MKQKTPMQELISIIRKRQEEDDVQTFMWHEQIVELAESLLEKEKEVMCGIYDDALARVDRNYIGGEGEEYYNETFKTKEK